MTCLPTRSSRRGRVAPALGLAALAFAAITLAAGPVEAQVNAEALRPDPLRAGWSRTIDGSLALATGNVALFDVGGAVRVQYQTVRPAPGGGVPFIRQRGLIAASARYAERADAAFIDQAFVHARWTAMWWPRVGSDAFAQHQRNQFLRLRGRAIAGVGVRVELVHRAAVLVWAGSGYMFEYNQLRVAPGASDPASSAEHRWTNYLTARVALADGRLLLQHTTYAQPRVDAPADVRILDELEALAKVTTVFAFGATLSVLHDSAPPTAVEPTDVRLLSTVRATF